MCTCTEAAAAQVAIQGLKTRVRNRPTSPLPWLLVGVHVVHVSGELQPASHPPRTLLITACNFKKDTLRRAERHGNARRCLWSRFYVKSAYIGEGNWLNECFK